MENILSGLKESMPKKVGKIFVDEYKKAMPRINFNGKTYFEIVEMNLILYNNNCQNMELLKGKTPKKGSFVETVALSTGIQQNRLTVITFATMFLECVIWDYAATNTSQLLTEKALGKMSLLGKWQVIPKLVNNNKNINIDSDGIGLLKKLVDERNDIVHSKSKPVPDSYEKLIGAIKTNTESKITIPETINCIQKCIASLKEIDTTNYWFLADNLATKTIPSMEVDAKVWK